MSYDRELARRLRAALAFAAAAHGWSVDEKPMFGGLAFMLDGRMLCGVIREDLVLRVGPERREAALARPHVRPMDFTGRPMKGFVYVAPPGVASAAALDAWLAEAAAYVRALPRKPRRA